MSGFSVSLNPVTTPPRIDDDRAAQALHDIAARRAAIDDPHREQLSDDPLDVLHVLAYLRKHTNVPAQVRGDDVIDALRLRIWLWWYGADLERTLLERAEQLGINRRDLGRELGIRTGQGVVDRRDRLAALLGTHGRPDEKFTRAERAAGRATESLPQRQQRWLDQHRAAVHAVASALVDHRDLADDEAAEWIVEVARDLRDQVCTPASYTQVFYAVDALATVPAVLELPDAHPLRRALRDWQVVSAQYRRARGDVGA